MPSNWLNKQEELRKQNEFVCNSVSHDEDMIEVQIVAQDDTVKKIVQEVKAFVKQQTKLNSENVASTKLGLVFKYLLDKSSLQADKLLTKIAEDLSMYHVSIERKWSSSVCVITGTLEGRELAKLRMRTLNL